MNQNKNSSDIIHNHVTARQLHVYYITAVHCCLYTCNCFGSYMYTAVYHCCFMLVCKEFLSLIRKMYGRSKQITQTSPCEFFKVLFHITILES